MKKIVIALIFICVLITNTACSNSSLNDSMEKNKEKDELLTDEIKDQNLNVTENNNLMEIKDFSVTDGKNSISLDSEYDMLEISQTEEALDNNYVGEIYSAEVVYKTYMHQYLDFDLYVSNSNYNLKNRNFDDYFITQITLKNSVFKTYRGITIGTDIEEVIRAYGDAKETTENGNTKLIYSLNDMVMQFEFDENQKVTGVVLYIVVDVK